MNNGQGFDANGTVNFSAEQITVPTPFGNMVIEGLSIDVRISGGVHEARANAPASPLRNLWTAMMVDMVADLARKASTSEASVNEQVSEDPIVEEPVEAVAEEETLSPKAAAIFNLIDSLFAGIAANAPAPSTVPTDVPEPQQGQSFEEWLQSANQQIDNSMPDWDDLNQKVDATFPVADAEDSESDPFAAMAEYFDTEGTSIFPNFNLEDVVREAVEETEPEAETADEAVAAEEPAEPRTISIIVMRLVPEDADVEGDLW
jgi:hypothetical protein